MTGSLDSAGLYRLMAWMSPGFPVGAYAYSGGLEWAVEEGRVPDAGSLGAWCRAVITHGAGRADANFFTGAWRAVDEDDADGLREVLVQAAAQRASREAKLESAAQGTAFLSAVTDAWDIPGFEPWSAILSERGTDIPYVTAVAAVCAAAGIPLREGLSSYLHALAANYISAGVRLIPLGQTDGQRTLAGLFETIEAAADRAIAQGDAPWGTAAPLLDLFSMQHETQYTRLFRS